MGNSSPKHGLSTGQLKNRIVSENHLEEGRGCKLPSAQCPLQIYLIRTSRWVVQMPVFFKTLWNYSRGYFVAQNLISWYLFKYTPLQMMDGCLLEGVAAFSYSTPLLLLSNSFLGTKCFQNRPVHLENYFHHPPTQEEQGKNTLPPKKITVGAKS